MQAHEQLVAGLNIGAGGSTLTHEKPPSYLPSYKCNGEIGTLKKVEKHIFYPTMSLKNELFVAS